MITTRKGLAVIGLAVAAILLQAGWASADIATWTDNFDSYLPGSNVHGQGGWVDSSGSGNAYQTVGGGGAGGTQGITVGSGSTQINWTGHGWDWGTLAVNDQVIARMDFQANGGGQFDDDRVGWITQVGSQQAAGNQSAYHFAVQLDNSAGGLETYFRNLSGSRVNQTTLMNWAALGTPTGSNWYREELVVTKKTLALGAGGAQVDVNFWALDGSGNVIAGSQRSASYGLIDTSALRGFSGTVYPMFKNYSNTPGNADNAYFQITPEPATLALLAVGGVLALVRRRRR
jgi:hypothetical protein